MSRFVVINFETATSYESSACAVGVVVFNNGQLTESFSRFIQPPGNRYHKKNLAIHSTKPEDTADAPPFNKVWPDIANLIGDSIFVAHNANVDIKVLNKSANYHSYTPPPVRFVCTYRLAEATYPNRHSYCLVDIAAHLGVTLENHHDPLNDAVAAGQIMCQLMVANKVTSIEKLTDKLGFVIGKLDQGQWTWHVPTHVQQMTCQTCGYNFRRLTKQKRWTRKPRGKFGFLWLAATVATSGLALFVYFALPLRDDADVCFQCSRCGARQ